MSQAIPPRADIQEAYDAFNRRDFEAWIALYDEDVEFFDLAEAPDKRAFRGHAGVRAWIAKLQEAWGEGFVRFEPHSIVEGGGAVVVDTRAKAVGGGSGVPIEMTFHTVLRFRDQKVVWVSSYIDRGEALEAAGLSE
jgi:ketosteroid isomerase-like protein